MSDYQVDPSWWVASNGKWYPANQHPSYVAPTSAAQAASSNIWDDTSGPSSPSSPRPATTPTESGGLWSKKLPWVSVAFSGLILMLILFGISASQRPGEASVDASASELTPKATSELGPSASMPRSTTTTSRAPSTTITVTTVAPTSVPVVTSPPPTTGFTVPPEAVAAAAQAQEAARLAQEQADAAARESAAAADAYVPPPPQSSSGSSSSGSSVYYSNCAAARAAGAAPLNAGEPGYSIKLDRDQDGTACE
jgi:hypothetical protein